MKQISVVRIIFHTLKCFITADMYTEQLCRVEHSRTNYIEYCTNYMIIAYKFQRIFSIIFTVVMCFITVFELDVIVRTCVFIIDFTGVVSKKNMKFILRLHNVHQHCLITASSFPSPPWLICLYILRFLEGSTDMDCYS